MKTKLIAVLSAMAVSWLALIFASSAVAEGPRSAASESSQRPGASPPSSSSQTTATKGAGCAILATPITPEEAKKKYPAPKGSDPSGEIDPHKPSGVISSP